MDPDPTFHAGAPGWLISPYSQAHEAAVRDLLLQCLREMATHSAEVEAEIEAYTARALAGDYRDIAAHYRPGRGRGFWLALRPSGELMGTFALQPAGEDAVELRRMYVGAGFRRRGLARVMLARAEALCVGWEVRRLFLTTSSLNGAAMELYRSAGFSQRDYVPPGVPPGSLPPGLRVYAFEKALSLPAGRGGLGAAA